MNINHQGQTRVYQTTWYTHYVRAQLGQLEISMILPPKYRFMLQLILSGVVNIYLICYSKAILKTQLTMHPRKTNHKYSTKQVLYFKKLIFKERNPYRINTLKESLNKQKIQIHVVIITTITITIYLILTAFAFPSSLDFHCSTSQSQKK